MDIINWYNFFEPKVKTWESARDLPKLLHSISDRDQEVRCLAYDAIGRLRYKENLKELCQAIKDEESPQVRSRGAIALGRLGGTEATISLCQMLDDEHVEVRAAAVRGLGEIKEPEMLSVFCAMLDDEAEDVVIEAIYALVALGNFRAVTSLHRIFDRCDRAMKDLTSMAINSINLNKPLERSFDEVYFFTYSVNKKFFCECYSYKLVTWRNHLRRRWQHPFARDWGLGYWEFNTLAQHITAKILPPGFLLEIQDFRA